MEGVSGLGGDALQAVMVGDSENDMNAGSRAGTLTCAVSYGFRTREQLSMTKPDVLIESVRSTEREFLLKERRVTESDRRDNGARTQE